MSPSSSNSISESVRRGYQYASGKPGYRCQAHTSTKVGDTAILIVHVEVDIVAVDRSGAIEFIIGVHSFDGALQSLRGSGQLIGRGGGLVFSGVVNGLLGREGVGSIGGDGRVGGMMDLWFLLRGRVRRQQLAFAGDGRRGCDMWRRNSRQGRL